MITSTDLKGIMAMMPAFTTKDGDRIRCDDTIDTDELTRAVDRINPGRWRESYYHHRELWRISYAALG